MPGLGLIPFLSIHKTSRPSSMLCKSWKMLSRHGGRCFPDRSVKVSVSHLLLLSLPKAHVHIRMVTGIKKYIVGLIIKTSSDSESLEKDRVYLGKLNMILVQILKYEWPKNWPTFISDIVGACKTNESLCQNNMAILKLLR